MAVYLVGKNGDHITSFFFFFFFFFSGVGVGVALVSFMIQNKVVVRTFSELYVEIKRGKKRSPGFVFFSEVSEECCLLLLLLVARGWSTRGAGRCHSRRCYLLSYICSVNAKL